MSHLPACGCSSCNFWLEKIEARDSPCVVRAAGFHYIIGPETDPPTGRGFGGHKYVIAFHDGRCVTTTNLWCQGEIPARFRAELPDNAIFRPDIQVTPGASS